MEDKQTAQREGERSITPRMHAPSDAKCSIGIPMEVHPSNVEVAAKLLHADRSYLPLLTRAA